MKDIRVMMILQKPYKCLLSYYYYYYIILLLFFFKRCHVCVCVCVKKIRAPNLCSLVLVFLLLGHFIGTLCKGNGREKKEKKTKTGAHAGNKLSFGFRPQSESSQQETLLDFWHANQGGATRCNFFFLYYLRLQGFSRLPAQVVHAPRSKNEILSLFFLSATGSEWRVRSRSSLRLFPTFWRRDTCVGAWGPGCPKHLSLKSFHEKRRRSRERRGSRRRKKRKRCGKRRRRRGRMTRRRKEKWRRK